MYSPKLVQQFSSRCLHYTKTDDHSVRKVRDAGYGGIEGFTYCNQYTACTFDGAPETLWQDMMDADAAAPRSAAYGYPFDLRSVQKQIMQCDAVYETYTDLLFSGQVPPSSLRQEVEDAFQRAGIDDIIAVKQRQLDRYLREGMEE